MKPIVVWGQQATHWTRTSMDWLDRRRVRVDVRLGAVAGVSLRRWLASVAMAAAAVCVAAAMLHVLLLAALRSGAGLGWFAVGVVAVVAVVLLVIVVRNTVMSIAAPQRRRAHLQALLVCAAALLAGVQACAAATVASAGHPVGLWPAEQLYAWHLADSVPLLAIPRRLEWSQPVIATGAGGRAILVAFTVALIVPLFRMLVAIYHLTGGGVPQSGGAALAVRRRPSISILRRIRLHPSGIAIGLVTAGGFMWGGLGRGTELGGRIAATSGLAFAGAVVAAGLGVLLIAVLLSIVIGVAKTLWEPISGGPWMQLALAAGLVWIDTPIRHALLPSVNGIGAPWKIVVTLGLWAVLTVVLLPIWVDPQLPESLLAIGLLLGFAGAGAPGGERLVAALGWTPGGFAIGPAVATAFAFLTGAYLAYLLSLAPARAANAGRRALGGAMDLRRELGGYASIGLQVITAAAGALVMLYALGMASASQPMDAPRSLLAVVWHVADSLPGPDVPGIAGWRPVADTTGPWAGAVVVLTVAALTVVVAFPMIRATLRWAKHKAGPPALERPLAEVPSALLTDLTVVRSFLSDSSRVDDLTAVLDIDSSAELSEEQEHILTAMHKAEERLTVAEADRGKLRDLLGEESPVYWAADHAVSEAVDAYRTVAGTQLSRHSLRWSPWPVRGTSAADAIAAIDVYAAAAERWQMGADVVAEIESRLHDLETRERDMQLRERDAETRERGVGARERGVDAREQVLTIRESATQTRERTVEAREQSAEVREREVDAREQSVEQRELSIGAQERVVDAREQAVTTREDHTEVREREVGVREQQTDAREQGVEAREQSMDVREREVDTREQTATSREQSVQNREHDAEVREGDVLVREREAGLREQSIEARERTADLREHSVGTREREIDTREQNADTREHSVGTRERKIAVREQEVDTRVQWLEAREQNADVREQSVVSREQNAAVREREIDARESRVAAREQNVQARKPTPAPKERGAGPAEHAAQPLPQ